MAILSMKYLTKVLVSTCKLLCFLAISFCSMVSYAQQTSPCWFNNPVNQQQLGFIGAASPFSTKANGSLIASRQRALNKLLAYYSLETRQQTLDFTRETITLPSGAKVIFSKPYSDHQAMYAYASIENKQDKIAQQAWLTQTCPLQTCNFKGCSPRWLCESKDNHIISVSQQTSNPAQQLDKTYENAQIFLQFISSSKVDDYSYKVKSEGKYQQWGYTEHKGQIQALADKHKLLNTQSCQTPSYMFAQYRYLESTTVKVLTNLTENTQSKPFSRWSKEPNLGNTTGVVGIFSGISADGLFSSTIKHSIKEGLLALAKSKQINIDHNYQIHNNNGLYTLARTTMTTSTTVSAKLQDIKIIEEDNQLVVYTWLLESNHSKK